MKQDMKNITLATIISICLVLCSTAMARRLSSVKISSQNTSIRAGEPLIIKLTYKYEQPQIIGKTDKVFSSLPHNAYYQVVEKATEANKPINPLPLFPASLILQDSGGKEYSSHFVIFYDLSKNMLAFDNPGKYILTVFGETKFAKKLSITVAEASHLEKEALSLLNDPNDLFFLELGLYEGKDARKESMVNLKKIVKQKPTTILAKWSAGRLGLEYFKDFHKKYPSFEKFRAKRKEEGLEEPLLHQTVKHLNIARGLPDDMPIREEVIDRLAIVQFLKDDLDMASVYIDELIEKYPSGRYGRKAAKGKVELEEIKRRESESMTYELFAKQQTIGVGEPIIVDVVINVPESVYTTLDRELEESVMYDRELFYVEKEGVLISKIPCPFDELKLENSPRLRYRATAVLFYDWFGKDLALGVPGNYVIRFGDWPATLEVKVEKPTVANELALSLIADPNDYCYLMMGQGCVSEEQRPKSLKHFSNVVKKCEGTFLAKVAAARLGIDYHFKHAKKNPGMTKFRSLYKKGKMNEPFFEKACEYLAIASKLPDGMPLREEVLYRLAVTESLKGNWDKATVYIDELAKKYPKGKYGKKAPRAKAELEEIKRRESEPLKKTDAKSD